MKRNLHKLAWFICIFICHASLKGQSITTTVNYPGSGLNGSCNVFNSVSTPATIGGLKHYPVSGGVTFDGTSISLGSQNNAGANTGTAYAIEYPFKVDYSYSISFTVSSTVASGDVAPTLYTLVYNARPDPNSTNPTVCGPVDNSYLPYSASNLIGTINPGSSFATSSLPTFTGTAGQSNIIIVAHTSSAAYNSFALIKQITITETPPQPSFTLSPASFSTSWGSSTSQAFTVTNVHNSPGVTSYSWDLGSSNNGWIYNGSPAPQTIVTSTNTLTLTSAICTNTLGNITATVTANNVNYNTNPSTCSVNFPSYSISGPSLICNSSTYSIPNLPSNMSAAWSVPSSVGPVLQFSPNPPVGQQITITNQKYYQIQTNLTAAINITGCSNTISTAPLTIANDNDNSSTQNGSYAQEACLFYNVSHPASSGTLSNPTFLTQGCLATITLNSMFGRQVSFTGATQPLYWSYSGPASNGNGTLYLQLPYGSGGIPFTFSITGDGACYQKSILFFSYSNNGNPASIRPVQITSTVTPEEQPKNNTTSYSISPNPVKDVLNIRHNVSFSKAAKKQVGNLESITFNVYEMSTGKLVLSKENSQINSLVNINVAPLSAGYYVLKIIDKSKIESIKFIKE